nr:hypothetical protein CFP56_66146 [Quercus suber]
MMGYGGAAASTCHQAGSCSPHRAAPRRTTRGRQQRMHATVDTTSAMGIRRATGHLCGHPEPNISGRTCSPRLERVMTGLGLDDHLPAVP